MKSVSFQQFHTPRKNRSSFRGLLAFLGLPLPLICLTNTRDGWSEPPPEISRFSLFPDSPCETLPAQNFTGPEYGVADSWPALARMGREARATGGKRKTKSQQAPINPDEIRSSIGQL